MCTIVIKEIGVHYGVTNAQKEIQTKGLKKVGVDMVLYTEKDTSIRIAKNLMMGDFFDAVELSSTCSLMELDVLPEWVGHSLRDLNLRAKNKINVIGIKRNDHLNINPDADLPLERNDVLIIIGKNEILNKLANK